MANQVIKRDGTKEPYDENKMTKSISDAGHDAGLPDDKIAAIVSQVGGVAAALAAGKEEIATSELGMCILAELSKVDPAVADAWKKNEAAKATV